MITGRKVLDKNRPAEEKNLVRWAKPYLTNKKRKILNIVDSRIRDQAPELQVTQLGELVLSCLQPEAKARPSMKEVVVMLERIE
jgi:interleukin-1 receptor-associated kinase 4